MEKSGKSQQGSRFENTPWGRGKLKETKKKEEKIKEIILLYRRPRGEKNGGPTSVGRTLDKRERKGEKRASKYKGKGKAGKRKSR